MTATALSSFWKQHSQDADFYASLEGVTGLTKDEVHQHFTAWNKLSYDEAEALAERHEVSVREAGFQAYLVELCGDNMKAVTITLHRIASDDQPEQDVTVELVRVGSGWLITEALDEVGTHVKASITDAETGDLVARADAGEDETGV